MLLAVLYAFLRLLIDLLILRGRCCRSRPRTLRPPPGAARPPTHRSPVSLATADRMILAALGRKLAAGALLLVQPATILGWYRALVHRRWAAMATRSCQWPFQSPHLWPGESPHPAGA